MANIHVERAFDEIIRTEAEVSANDNFNFVSSHFRKLHLFIDYSFPFSLTRCYTNTDLPIRLVMKTVNAILVTPNQVYVVE